MLPAMSRRLVLSLLGLALPISSAQAAGLPCQPCAGLRLAAPLIVQPPAAGEAAGAVSGAGAMTPGAAVTPVDRGGHTGGARHRAIREAVDASGTGTAFPACAAATGTAGPGGARRGGRPRGGRRRGAGGGRGGGDSLALAGLRYAGAACPQPGAAAGGAERRRGGRGGLAARHLVPGRLAPGGDRRRR